MSTTQIGIIIGVLVLGGGTYVAIQSSSDDSGAEENTRMQDEAETTTNSGNASFVELIRNTEGNVRCEFSYTDEETVANVSGVMHMADDGQQLRGDFTMDQNGEVFESHMIRDGSTMYTWGETPQGTMGMTFEVEEPEDITEVEGANLDQSVEYSCEAWNVDRSMFEPPEDVNFMDQTQQFNDMEQMQENMQDSQCAACDQVQDPQSREQCRQALQCE